MRDPAPIKSRIREAVVSNKTCLATVFRSIIIASSILVGSFADSHAAQTITFAWPGVLTSGIAPFTFAGELGYFAKEGLSLDVIVLKGGSGEIAPQLLSGRIFAAFVTPDGVILTHQPGKPNFPIRFIYNAVRNSIWEIVVLKDSNIKSLADLSGKKIGVGGLTFGNVLMTQAMLSHAGVDASHVDFIPVGTGFPASYALKRGQVDALNLFDVVDATIEAQGTPLRRLPLPPEFVGVSSHGIAVSDASVREHPQEIAGFGRAVAEGTVACEANVRRCLLSYWSAFPTQKPVVLNDEVLTNEEGFLRVRLKNMTYFPEKAEKRYGSYSAQDWDVVINSLKAGGKLETLPDPNEFYTNQFDSAFNAFDKNTVFAKANSP